MDIGMARLWHVSLVYCVVHACCVPSMGAGASVIQTSVLQDNWMQPDVRLDLKKMIEYMYHVSLNTTEKIREITGLQWSKKKITTFKEGMKWLYGCVFKNDLELLYAQKHNKAQAQKHYQYSCDYMPPSMQAKDSIFATSAWMDWLYARPSKKGKIKKGMNRHAEKRGISYTMLTNVFGSLEDVTSFFSTTENVAVLIAQSIKDGTEKEENDRHEEERKQEEARKAAEAAEEKRKAEEAEQLRIYNLPENVQKRLAQAAQQWAQAEKESANRQAAAQLLADQQQQRQQQLEALSSSSIAQDLINAANQAQDVFNRKDQKYKESTTALDQSITDQEAAHGVFDQANNDLVSVKQAVIEYDIALKNAQDEQGHVQTDVQDKKEKIDKQTALIASQKKQLKAKEREKTSAQSALEKAQSALDTVTKKTKSIDDAAKKAQKAYDDVVKKNTASEKTKTDLENEKQDTEASIKQLEANQKPESDKKKPESDNKKPESDNKKPESDNKKPESDNKKLNKQMKDIQNNLTKVTKELEGLAKKKDTTKKARDAALEKQRSHKASVDSKQAALNTAKGKVDTIQQSIDTLKTKIQTEKDTVASLNTDLATLEADLTAKNSAVTDAQTKLDDARQSQDAAQTARDAAQSAYDDAQNRHDTCVKKNKDAFVALQTAEQEYNKAVQNAEDAQSKAGF